MASIDRVDELGAGRAHGSEIEALQQRQRLQEDGPLAPGPDLVRRG